MGPVLLFVLQIFCVYKFSFFFSQSEYSWAISKLLFLDARKGNSASGCANLVSCGGNGIVRFWNSSHNTLMAEFTAHQHG